jgi:hypothetical protein
LFVDLNSCVVPFSISTRVPEKNPRNMIDFSNSKKEGLTTRHQRSERVAE